MPQSLAHEGYLVKPLDIPQILPSIRVALQRAEEIQKLHQAEIDLCTTMKTSRTISMAIGFLMEQFGIGAGEAFEALRGFCRSNRKKMIEVAGHIVESRQSIDLSPYLSVTQQPGSDIKPSPLIPQPGSAP